MSNTKFSECLSKDALVFVNGDILSAEEIWDTYKSDIMSDAYGGFWTKPNKLLWVNSYDIIKRRMTKKPVVHLYRREIDCEVREIVLENGYKITVGLDTKFLKVNGWTSDMKVDEYISIPKKLYNFEGYGGLIVTKDLAYLLGWQISEGYENEKYVGITQNDIKTLESVKKCAINVEKQYNVEMNSMSIKKHSNGKANVLHIGSTQYVNLLEKYGYVFGMRSAHKRFPIFIMNMSMENIKIFLRAYFDAEAFMSLKEGVIEISSASEVIIKQLDFLCRLFGINMRLKLKMKMATNGKRIKRPYYIGLISSHSLRIFKKEIGFNIDYKQEALGKSCLKKCNTNIEIIPITKKLDEIYVNTHLPKRRFINFMYLASKKYEYRLQKPTIQTLEKTCENLEGVLIDKIFLKKNDLENNKIFIRESIKDLKNEIDKEVFYIKIISIKKKPYIGFVYDLEIPETYNFVANGILCHGSNYDIMNKTT